MPDARSRSAPILLVERCQGVTSTSISERSVSPYLNVVSPTASDGSRSLYFRAPEGSVEGPLVQIIYHRPLSQ